MSEQTPPGGVTTPTPQSSGVAGRGKQKTRVVNVNRREPYDEYIGRGSAWGNPYKIGQHGTREEVIEKYRAHVVEMLEDPYWQRRLEQLRGKRLGCYCKPKDGFKGRLLCHGQVLAGLADGVPPESIS